MESKFQILSLAVIGAFLAFAYNFRSNLTIMTSPTANTTEPVRSPYESFCKNMVVMHTVLRRGFNSGIKNYESENVQALVGYTRSLLDTLKMHHRQEEEIIFPSIEKALHRKELSDEHESVTAAIGKVEAVLNAATNENKFQAAEYKTAMEDLLKVLEKHLKHEEEELTAENLKKYYEDETYIAELGTRVGKDAMKSVEKTTVLSFILTHLTDDEKLIMFSKVPYFVREYIFPVYTFINYSYWQYSSKL